jgi:hypothetical protein
MSRKALEKEHFSPYTGFVRGTWREGSHTERHVMEGSGNTSFLL